MSNRCVHTEHCCKIHGCNYNKAECPVETGLKVQSYMCEFCSSTIDTFHSMLNEYREIVELQYNIEFMDNRND